MSMKWHFPLILDGESFLKMSKEEQKARIEYGNDFVKRYLNGEFVNETIEETKKAIDEGKKVYEAQQKRLGKKSYW